MTSFTDCKVHATLQAMADVLDYLAMLKGILDRDMTPAQMALLSTVRCVDCLTPEMARGVRDVSLEIKHKTRRAA